MCDHCGYESEETEDIPSTLEKDGDQAGWSCPACNMVHTVTLCVEYSFKAVPGYNREFGIASGDNYG